MNASAILIFARTALQESYNKTLSGDKDTDVLVYERLNRQVVALAAKTGLPYFIYDESRQAGGSFGEKLGNAVADIFNKGFDKLIILGNDCPQLTKTDLNNAIKKLEQRQLVLGPDLRGGAYLIGLTKNIFHKGSFSKLPWQTNRLLAALEQVSSACILPSHADINDLSTIRPIIASLHFSSSIRKVLSALLCGSKQFISIFITCNIRNLTDRHFALRAPPVVI